MAVNDISRVYATSLVELSQDKGILDQIEEEFHLVTSLYNEDKDLRIFLTSPGIMREKKNTLVDKVFGGQLHEQLVNFLKVLINNDRQSVIPDIYEAMIELIDDIQNRLRVTVASSVDLGQNLKDKIQAELKAKYNKEIILKAETDESLLGGIIIKIGDIVIDGSLVKDLKNIRNNLNQSKVRSEVAYEN